jgi:hypothetical protein
MVKWWALGINYIYFSYLTISIRFLQPKGDIFGGPPVRNNRRPPTAPKPGLDTINERPKVSSSRPDTFTSTTTSATAFNVSALPRAARPSSPGGESVGSEEGSSSHQQQHQHQQEKKVQKGQINALAKLLTSFSKTTRSRD